MPDYSRAFSSDDGIGVWNGRNSTGENVMALSLVIRNGDGTAEGVLRYLVSLSLIDQQLLVMMGVMVLFSVIVVFFVVLSSAYFVNSIVYPVTEIGRAARRIALGDYDYRLVKSMTTKSAISVTPSTTWQGRSPQPST